MPDPPEDEEVLVDVVGTEMIPCLIINSIPDAKVLSSISPFDHHFALFFTQLGMLTDYSADGIGLNELVVDTPTSNI